MFWHPSSWWSLSLSRSPTRRHHPRVRDTVPRLKSSSGFLWIVSTSRVTPRFEVRERTFSFLPFSGPIVPGSHPGQTESSRLHYLVSSLEFVQCRFGCMVRAQYRTWNVKLLRYWSVRGSLGGILSVGHLLNRRSFYPLVLSYSRRL